MNQTSQFDLLPFLGDAIAGSSLLPRAYATYRLLLVDALSFFLRHLSRARLRGILTEQQNMPASAAPAERVVALLSHLPVLHKLGQVVARDRRLTKGFRRRLQQLESMSPRTPMTVAQRLLEAECKSSSRAGIQLEPRPLAEGSVAIILPFTWQEGRRPARRGVFKLLKPGARARLEEDLEILSKLGAFLDERCSDYGLPPLDYRDTFNTIKELLLHEIRFEEEQRNLTEAARLFAEERSVVIPALFPFCGTGVTAMERLDGVRIPISGGSRTQALPDGAAGVIADALIAQPLVSSQPAALFHADPHAGNLLLLPENRVGILDWSLTGRLSRRERVALVQLLIGGWTLDLGRMERAVEQLGSQSPTRSATTGVLQAALHALHWPGVPGVAWLRALLDRLVLRAGVRFKTNLLLFRKTLLTLEGVLADLCQDPEAVLDAAVAAAFLNHWTAEWPAQILAPWSTRSLTTHLSTSDLFSLAWSGPATLTRWSVGSWNWNNENIGIME